MLWENSDVCAKQYMCALDICLMTVLSSLYGIIMDCEINVPSQVQNVFDGINATVKRYLKKQMEHIGKISSKNTSNIGVLPSVSKYVSIKFSYQCIHIHNNKYR